MIETKAKKLKPTRKGGS